MGKTTVAEQQNFTHISLVGGTNAHDLKVIERGNRGSHFTYSVAHEHRVTRVKCGDVGVRKFQVRHLTLADARMHARYGTYGIENNGVLAAAVASRACY